MRFGIGQPVRRLEDASLISGRGRFLDDVNYPDQVYAWVLRSPHAHARIRSIDCAAARSHPATLDVLTGADLERDGIGPLPCVITLQNRDGSQSANPSRPLLALDKVRLAGDAVAMVVARSLQEAKDAAEAIVVDYEALPTVVDATEALKPDAPLLYDELGSNSCMDWEAGDAAAVDTAFRGAVHVASVSLVNNRVVAHPMEPRGAIGVCDRDDGRLTLVTSSQGTHDLRDILSRFVLQCPADRLRVVVPDVGGGFGTKIFPYPEQGLVLWAARRLKRPVKWVSDRSEAFLTDCQGRDHVTHAEAALDASGRMTALRVDIVANLGAYLSTYGPYVPTFGCCHALPGPYAIGAVHARVRGAFTSTVPVDAYRGAGRPEASYLLERLMDVAARDLGLSPAEIRRRNLIPVAAMPYLTAMGSKIDSGDFVRNLDQALVEADWDGLAQRKLHAATLGRARGLGVSVYLEACGGARAGSEVWNDPVGRGADEMAEVRIERSGAVTILIGTQSSGQGHRTAFAQIAASALGVDLRQVRIIQGDTDLVAYGNGTGGSRSIPVAGNALHAALDKVIVTGRRWAGFLLEADEGDIDFADGLFRVAGTDRTVTLANVAAAAYLPQPLPPGLEFGLSERSHCRPTTKTFPNGCHIAEVEIDLDTGVISIVDYVAVDDFGRVINPLLVEGQVHGGVVQGIGQALMEHCAYDAQSGQLLSGSLMDYQLPRADNVPSIRLTTNEVPCTTNALGVKGAGEAGAVAAPAAIINAILDALAPHGVTDIDMPATPDRIWSALASRARCDAGGAAAEARDHAV